MPLIVDLVPLIYVSTAMFSSHELINVSAATFSSHEEGGGGGVNDSGKNSREYVTFHRKTYTNDLLLNRLKH